MDESLNGSFLYLELGLNKFNLCFNKFQNNTLKLATKFMVKEKKFKRNSSRTLQGVDIVPLLKKPNGAKMYWLSSFGKM